MQWRVRFAVCLYAVCLRYAARGAVWEKRYPLRAMIEVFWGHQVCLSICLDFNDKRKLSRFSERMCPLANNVFCLSQHIEQRLKNVFMGWGRWKGEESFPTIISKGDIFTFKIPLVSLSREKAGATKYSFAQESGHALSTFWTGGVLTLFLVRGRCFGPWICLCYTFHLWFYLRESLPDHVGHLPSARKRLSV